MPVPISCEEVTLRASCWRWEWGHYCIPIWLMATYAMLVEATGLVKRQGWKGVLIWTCTGICLLVLETSFSKLKTNSGENNSAENLQDRNKSREWKVWWLQNPLHIMRAKVSERTQKSTHLDISYKYDTEKVSCLGPFHYSSDYHTQT